MKFIKFRFKKVKSTNSTAIRIIKNSNIKFGMVISDNQSSGKGQHGKKWISYKGNLFVSIFFSLKKINLTLKQLTILNAKLIIKLISYYYQNKIKLKLPNDILIKKRKICGILQETVQKNDVTYLVIGIGLNLVKSPNIENCPTTNLYELTKKKLSAKKMTKELVFIYNDFLKIKKVF